MVKPHPAPEPADPDAEAFAVAVREGIDDARKGRTVPYEDVRRWLLSWGTDDERPPPECR
ncbi:CopG family transcriptional regulator [Azospirillum sp. RWY-5-1]|uniref:CopG family transcriptional regulator n=1 Tax=Azospirillum oleiclasticum TaxID=2735135 RepID=A0ABX2TM65_9PROT|nr:CopG family transcriptional regulator [Azospirillum oleiclasticum]NYZ17924.1 CopG family transcriptional regulator [Azospirillum oleiclasticum]NYZ24606.1 CopG family transcriptional regulator [Azospirillum oleiclasticum]